MKFYKGLPLPYTLRWLGDKPDFTTLDNFKVVTCATSGICGVCGQRFSNPPYAFIGGIQALQTKAWSVDPPMHVNCAAMSFILCPFLRGERIRNETVITPGVDVTPDSGKYGILIAESYERHRNEMAYTKPTGKFFILPKSEVETLAKISGFDEYIRGLVKKE